MRLIGWFNLAAVVAGLMALAMAYYLVPDKAWSDAAITSIVVFSLSVGFIFYLPSLITKQQHGRDSIPIASIGPLGFLTGLIPIISAVAFILALKGMDNIAFAVNVFAVGFFIISWLMLRASADVISNVETTGTAPSKHISWQSEIQGLCCATSDNTLKNTLDKLAEKLRYAASDVPGGSTQDSQIENEIQSISDLLAVNKTTDVQAHISNVEMLLQQRDIYLRSARNKA